MMRVVKGVEAVPKAVAGGLAGIADGEFYNTIPNLCFGCWCL